MVERSQTLESLTAEERITLIGRLWDSLDPAAAAPISAALAAELDRREAEADAISGRRHSVGRPPRRAPRPDSLGGPAPRQGPSPR